MSKCKKLTIGAVCGAAVVLAAVAGWAMGRPAARTSPGGPVDWPALEKGFTLLYDGRDTSRWKQAGPGRFVQQPDGSLLSEGGMGLFWYAERPFKDFILRVDWKAEKAESNSGIFVRFPDPQGDPWKPVNEGYEIQIQDAGGPKHRTGAVYSFSESYSVPTKPYGQWNTMEIEVVGQRYLVRVNGTLVTRFTGSRATEGYIGLQNHGGGDRVWFRNIRIKPLN
ncbi:MAG: hypothetical protein KatS3mg024_1712 [Armatimonadota bacterium]|jgi:hypothetical protein|nr:MAG: hypothetical protein KatS3mg024_1712 [Armatimonadota bacterium]